MHPDLEWSCLYKNIDLHEEKMFPVDNEIMSLYMKEHKQIRREDWHSSSELRECVAQPTPEMAF